MNLLMFRILGLLWCCLGIIVTAPSINNIEDEGKCIIAQDEEINFENIANLEGCPQINGNVIINTVTFLNMHPNELYAFSRVKSITGYLNIEKASHPEFKNLSCFRHLEVIHGVTPNGEYYSLNIENTSLESLELNSLKHIKGSSGVSILLNKDLCYAGTIEWENIVGKDANKVVIDNRPVEDCEAEGLTCDSQCIEGCWGPGTENCVRCKYYQKGTQCVDFCDISNDDCRKGCPSTMFEENGKCFRCDEQCSGCHGPSANNCTFCKHVKNDYTCVQMCPDSKYPHLGECTPCPGSCTCGCSATDGHDCNECSSSDDDNSNIICEVGYFYNSDTISCNICHEECADCYGPGPDQCKSCNNKKLFKFPESDPKFTCTSNSEAFINCNQDPIDKSVYYCYKRSDLLSSVVTVLVTLIVTVIIYTVILIFTYGFINLKSKRYKPLNKEPNHHKEYVNRDANAPVDEHDYKDIPDNNFSCLSTSPTSTFLHKFGLNTVTAEYCRQGTFGPLYKTKSDSPKHVRKLIQVLYRDVIESIDNLESRIRKINNLEHERLLKVSVEIKSTDLIMLITDLMPLGTILNYVQAHKKTITPNQLLNWCQQIAEGMAYLEQNSIVHGNLSARTVLLHEDYSVKIKDFGRIHLIGDYYKQKKFFNCCRGLRKLNTSSKYADVETYAHPHDFSHKSDVWAFGLTMFELLTFGQDPWMYLSFNTKNPVRSQLEWGISVPCPKMCKDAMYRFLKSCWYNDANKRPNFNELSNTLKGIIENPKDYYDVNIRSE